MLQFSCRFACYHVIVSQTAYRKNVNFDTASSKRANFDEIQFLKHTPMLIIFGTHNLRTHTHIIQNLGLDARACVQGSCRRRQWAETASHRLLVKSVSGHHRRRNRPVASATPSMCEGQATPILSIFCIKTGSFQSHPRFPEETCIIFGMQFERR